MCIRTISRIVEVPSDSGTEMAITNCPCDALNQDCFCGIGYKPRHPYKHRAIKSSGTKGFVDDPSR